MTAGRLAGKVALISAVDLCGPAYGSRAVVDNTRCRTLVNLPE